MASNKKFCLEKEPIVGPYAHKSSTVAYKLNWISLLGYKFVLSK
jgi:hypothetical protein